MEESYAARGLLAVTGCGYLLAAARPEDVDLNLHVLGALLLFGSGNLALVLAAAAPGRSPIGRPRLASLALGLLGLAATVLYLRHHHLGPPAP